MIRKDDTYNNRTYIEQDTRSCDAMLRRSKAVEGCDQWFRLLIALEEVVYEVL